ncbi:MAG: aldehyde dehydrogenase family protein [Desulfatiglandaceae bacterium]
MRKYGHYINGEWVESEGGRTFESTDPATGLTLGEFARGTQKDVSRAVDAGERAFSRWKRFLAPKRGEMLPKAASIMRERKDALGEIVTKEMGKVISEEKGDVQEAIDFLEYIFGERRRLFGETTTSELRDKFLMTIRQPIGAEVHLPFGCVKNTGNGAREAGTAAIEEFTETKTVFIDYSRNLQKAQIRE